MKVYKELRKEDLFYILEEIKRLEIEHPKARVVYDVERDGIYIYYPLPKDYGKLKQFKQDKYE